MRVVGVGHQRPKQVQHLNRCCNIPQSIHLRDQKSLRLELRSQSKQEVRTILNRLTKPNSQQHNQSSRLKNLFRPLLRKLLRPLLRKPLRGLIPRNSRVIYLNHQLQTDRANLAQPTNQTMTPSTRKLISHMIFSHNKKTTLIESE